MKTHKNKTNTKTNTKSNTKNTKNTKKNMDYFKKIQQRHKHLTIRRVQINGAKSTRSRK